MENPKTRKEEDWLAVQYIDRETKEACLLTMSALVGIARSCCKPALSLDETTELLETVWYEMVYED